MLKTLEKAIFIKLVTVRRAKSDGNSEVEPWRPRGVVRLYSFSHVVFSRHAHIQFGKCSIRCVYVPNISRRERHTCPENRLSEQRAHGSAAAGTAHKSAQTSRVFPFSLVACLPSSLYSILELSHIAWLCSFAFELRHPICRAEYFYSKIVLRLAFARFEFLKKNFELPFFFILEKFFKAKSSFFKRQFGAFSSLK